MERAATHRATRAARQCRRHVRRPADHVARRSRASSPRWRQQLDAFVDVHPLGVGLQAAARAVPRARAATSRRRASSTPRSWRSASAPAERGVMAADVSLRARDARRRAARSRARADALRAASRGAARRGASAAVRRSDRGRSCRAQLARLAGRPEDAARHFEDALALGRRMASPPLVVARAGVARRASSCRAIPTRPRVRASSGRSPRRRRAREQLGLADVSARVGAAAGEARRRRRRRRTSTCSATKARCGACVTRGRELRLKDGKGPRYLASLLAAPGREVHVLAVRRRAGAPAARRRGGRRRRARDRTAAARSTTLPTSARAAPIAPASRSCAPSSMKRSASRTPAAPPRLRAELEQLASALAIRYARRGGTRARPGGDGAQSGHQGDPHADRQAARPAPAARPSSARRGPHRHGLRLCAARADRVGRARGGVMNQRPPEPRLRRRDSGATSCAYSVRSTPRR